MNKISMAEKMEQRGIDMSWYRPNRNRAKIIPTKVADNCGYFSWFLVKYENGWARVHTITTSGEAYRLDHSRETKKTGEPIYWCANCNEVFRVFSALTQHAKQKDSAQHQPAENIQASA